MTAYDFLILAVMLAVRHFSPFIKIRKLSPENFFIFFSSKQTKHGFYTQAITLFQEGTHH